MVPCHILTFTIPKGVHALFSFDIEGDVGVDPDLMTLNFFQGGLGLPSKVRVINVCAPSGLDDTLYRTIMLRMK